MALLTIAVMGWRFNLEGGAEFETSILDLPPINMAAEDMVLSVPGGEASAPNTDGHPGEHREGDIPGGGIDGSLGAAGEDEEIDVVPDIRIPDTQNSLRSVPDKEALEARSGSAEEGTTVTHDIAAPEPEEIVYATFYGTPEDGYGYNCPRQCITASGEWFDPDGLTAATFLYPLGSRLTVCGDSGCVSVRVNDRGPGLDLSRGAFERLAPLSSGRIRVTVRED